MTDSRFIEQVVKECKIATIKAIAEGKPALAETFLEMAESMENYLEWHKG